MEHEISLDESRRILEIRLSPTAAHRAHEAAREELLELCRTRGIRKVLVDARALSMAGGPSTMQLFEFGVSWSQNPQGRSLALAGVLPADAAARKEVRFGITVAHNRGFLTRSFLDIQEAREWLANLDP